MGMVLAVALCACRPAAALNKDRTLAQYVHTLWGADRGYTGGRIYAIAQSQDGYLWLGTENGLLRFDGVNFLPVAFPIENHRGAIRGLVDDVEGNLWIRLDGPRLVRYRDGKFEDAVLKFDLHESIFMAMTRSEDGHLLLWGPQNRTLRFQNDHFQSIAPQETIDDVVISVAETTNGVLWFGARDEGLYKMMNGVLTRELTGPRLHSLNSLVPSDHGGVWAGAEGGFQLWEKNSPATLKIPEGLQKAQIFALVRDQDRNLWVGTEDGLYRIDMQTEVVTGFYRNDKDPAISSIYEDHDGNVWFAGSHGLEQFRDGMFTTFSAANSTAHEFGGSLFVEGPGRVWFGPASGGLFSLEHGVIKRVQIPGKNDDVVYSIHGVKDDIWLGRQEGGLTELVRRGDQWLSHTYTQKDGLAQNSVYTVTRARDGSVWAGTVSAGISVLRDGHFQSYNADNELHSNAIFSSLETSDKKMWFVSPSGLACYDGIGWKRYDTLTAPNVRTMFEDSGHIIWVGTSQGLARLEKGLINLSNNLPQVLSEEIFSIGQDAKGFLWIVTSGHILQVDREKLLSGTLKESDLLTYGPDDGLVETEGVRRDRSLVSDSMGRIWISLAHSLAFADVQAAGNYLKPVPVRIDSATSDSGLSILGENPDLPSATRSITFRYTGTGLGMPQRIRFRYILQGLDQTWSTDASLRQVTYSHLPPGPYTFRIMGSNALGMWKGQDAHITFRVQPAIWQTWYAQTLAVLLAAGTVVVLYRFRVHKVEEQLNRRFQDRLAERTRIAQDLHDTLLQGVISASMQLDVAQEDVPDNSPAKPKLGRILRLMGQVTEEGRAALRGLRSDQSATSLEEQFTQLIRNLPPSENSELLIHVQGNSSPLKPEVSDEVCRIGREACMNAASHSKGERIEVLLDYGIRSFRLTVKDNGCGIAPEVLRNGREGHWGLAGMRERARAIGSVLKIRTRTPGGTEVILSVPGSIAYASGNLKRMQWPHRLWKRYPKPERDASTQ